MKINTEVDIELDNIINEVVFLGKDAVFDLIVNLEKAVADGDFLERVFYHFQGELSKECSFVEKA